ncbi:MAG: hypothetical protein C0459_14950 [Chitinophaga sp.]|jgi:hypothetical protein|nr:hypothetical protein [Chitinophaga sp.]
MKKVFYNISLKKFLLRTIAYGLIIVLIDFFEGRFKLPDINVTRLIISYTLQFTMFGLIMSLLFDNIVQNKSFTSNEN